MLVADAKAVVQAASLSLDDATNAFTAEVAKAGIVKSDYEAKLKGTWR